MSGCERAVSDVLWGDQLGYKPRIVTTTGMVTELVQQVVGDRADVTGLLKTGVDPHGYRATLKDIGRLVEADLIIYSGLQLEGPLERVFKELSADGKLVFAVTDGLARENLLYPEGIAGHPDPHVWNDLDLWIACVLYTTQELCRLMPEHALEFQQRSETYVAELSLLDEYVRQAMASIPPEQRYLVTAHDAFGYWSRAYDIPVRSVQGITTSSEPAIADINALVELLVEHQIPAVFIETSVSDRGLRAVRDGVRARGWNIRFGTALYSDSMGAPGTYEGTFVGMIDHNATHIARELGGSVPDQGYQDWRIKRFHTDGISEPGYEELSNDAA